MIQLRWCTSLPRHPPLQHGSISVTLPHKLDHVLFFLPPTQVYLEPWNITTSGNQVFAGIISEAPGQEIIWAWVGFHPLAGVLLRRAPGLRTEGRGPKMGGRSGSDRATAKEQQWLLAITEAEVTSPPFPPTHTYTNPTTSIQKESILLRP